MKRDNQADRSRAAEADLIALAAEAERGYDPDRITRAPGRPRIGALPAVVLPVRLHADLHAAVKRRAAVERTSVSELVRYAALQYLESEAPQPREATSAAEVSPLAVEAEAGYDDSTIRAQQRPPRGRAEVVPVRVPPELKERLETRASSERTSVSEIIRAALRALLGDPEADPPTTAGGSQKSGRRPSEADTCRDYVLPRLKDAGWTDDQIVEQYRITDGRISQGRSSAPASHCASSRLCAGVSSRVCR